MICVNKKCGTTLPDDAIYCLKCGKKQVAEPKKHRKRPNGEGSVYNQGNNRAKPWMARKAGIFIGSYATRAAAIAALEKLGEMDITDRFNMTFKQLYENWKAEHYRDLTEKGKVGYDVAYKHFEELHNEKFRSLKASDYQRVVDKQIDAGKSRSSTEKDRQLISQMCKWAMRDELIMVNYGQFIKLQDEKVKAKEIFTDDEVEKFYIEAATNDVAKIVCMLLSTGMRIGELFSIPAADVYDKYCIGGEKTEAGRNRVIPIRPEGRAFFAYFKSRAGLGLLMDGFTGNHGGRNFRERNYYPMLDKLKIRKLSPHATRHTYTSRAVKEGMPRELLQKILGHASYVTTADVYVHSDLETLINAVEPALKSDEKKVKQKKNSVR